MDQPSISPAELDARDIALHTLPMTNGTETLKNGNDSITARYFDAGAMFLQNSKGETWVVDNEEWQARRAALLANGWRVG